jgi:hypothetical protein
VGGIDGDTVMSMATDEQTLLIEGKPTAAGRSDICADEALRECRG